MFVIRERLYAHPVFPRKKLKEKMNTYDTQFGIFPSVTQNLRD